MLAAGILLVHNRMAAEHSIDQVVIRSFRTEFFITGTGIFLIILGYVLEIIFLGGFHHLLTCHGTECTAAAAAALE